ncbi:MAG: hypothetical protein ACM3N9_07690, partial [Syntrophothermus sp.]
QPGKHENHLRIKAHERSDLLKIIYGDLVKHEGVLYGTPFFDFVPGIADRFLLNKTILINFNYVKINEDERRI